MNKVLLSISAVFLFASTSAFASHRPVQSLHDLPSRWEGVAGGLLTKVPATFSIAKVRKVTRDNDSPLSATYEVDAALTFGERLVNVNKITLTQYTVASENFEVMLFSDDELAMTTFAVVHYDEASNSYSLKEIPRYGERRFSFSAPAPH